MEFAPTAEQQAVIDDRGGSLLVSAAAGSGKTRVLVERLLNRVEQEGVDIDRFLVITYTKAAAAELRARIVSDLSERLASRPGDRHLRRQTTLIYQAQISTIHAFCAQLLRASGHLLDVNPDFRLADEGEARILMFQALDDVLETRYENLEGGSDFAKLVDTLSAGRDDSRLVEIVLDIRSRIQSHPDPDAWLAEQERVFALEGVTDAGETEWGQLLLEDVGRQARYWTGRIAEALEVCACDPNLASNYAGSLSATLEALRYFAAGTEEGWDAARAALPIPFPGAGRKKMEDCPEEAARVKTIRLACKGRMEKLEDLFLDCSADLLADMRAMYPAIRGLFALVRDFETAYTARKERRGLLDFSDLEHLTVRLLVGEHGPTALAQQWAEKFEEIMVDEYQDTNEVQNAIFNALSREDNLFMVGDVKQSIYRFRLADPTIFLDKYQRFRPQREAMPGEPRRINLTQNFRSRSQVLEGANYLFYNIMSAEFGEMAYTKEEALVPGAAYPADGERYAVELAAIDCTGAEESAEEAQIEKPSRDLLEARFAARRIASLLEEGFPVQDGGELRQVRPSDIVILLRSPGTVLHHYARALGERGIPWEAEGGGDFFAAAEVLVALALLQVVDNPRQDIPLIAVLRAPVYGFTADKLAQIRASTPDGDFYSALEHQAQTGDRDCGSFLEELSNLRFGAGDKSCYQLLWHIYDRTNLIGIFGAMEGGEGRQANLLTLAELARRFEGAGYRGLFPFLTYLTRLQDNGGRIATPAAGRTGGGVRIMSIHRSKGLEFPVVVLCGLARRLNREDIQRPILFHPKLGVGPKFLDTDRMVEYPTLARRAVARKLEYEMMAEELRLLYVAATRAREKLIFSCALSSGGKELAKLAGDVSLPVDPQVLFGCSSVAQWVLLPVLARPEAHTLRAAAELSILSPAADYGPAWDIYWVDGGTLEEVSSKPQAVQTSPETTAVDPNLVARLTWQYPYQREVDIPSKLTATQLKGRTLDQEAAEDAVQSPVTQITTDSLRQPRFAQEEFGLTPAQKGTAIHLAMQYLNFQSGDHLETVSAELDRLVREAYMTPEQREAVDPERIVAFFRAPLGREMMASVSLHREFKFSILAEAAQYYPGAGPGEQVLLQGVVDCFFETLEGITIIDFKTDRVNRRWAYQRAQDYASQLNTYAQALEEITGKPVVRRVLWFFHADTAVELKAKTP